MNIDEINGYPHTKQPSTDRKVRDDKKFDQILNDAVDSVGHEKRALDEFSPVRGIDLPLLWDRGHVEQPALQHAYNILDLLEEYSQALSNPHMTLKWIEPIVTRIEQELKGLDAQSWDNAVRNHELGGIINEIAVTANIEAFKFKRGDYIV